MITSFTSGIVRFSKINGEVVGAGFLVSKKHILTCAHVVNAALGKSLTATEKPTSVVYLDFPQVAQGNMLSARVVHWIPVQSSISTQDITDIAVLKLESKPPDQVKPVRLVTAQELWGHHFQLFGFPIGRDSGVWTNGILRHSVGGGRVQMQIVQQTAYRVESGFSGAPVWDEDLDGIAGMTVTAEKSRERLDVKAAFMIPTTQLVKAFPQLSQQAIPSCPYRGLFAFREEDAKFFFGREKFTERLKEVVQTKPLVAVIGPSGSGKSSVVFAGLIPQLRSAQTWLINSFRPGDRPFHNLAAKLVPLLENHQSETDQLAEVKNLARKLQEGELTLRDVVQRILEKNSGIRLLLVADQFEELYALCPHEEERQCFLHGLLEAVSTQSQNNTLDFTLIIALRADFYAQALLYRPFSDALQQHANLTLGPLNSQELQEVVKKPAQELGVQIENGLTERILEVVSKQPGNLPLLQFALTQLWKRQKDSKLTHTAYEKIGGVEESLARHADEVYGNFKDKQQQRVQQVLIQLVSPGDGTEDTRRQATRRQVGEDNWDIVTSLANARLVVTGQSDATGEETVEMAHEALIRAWEPLRHWMDSARKFRIWQEELRFEVRQWKNCNKDESALLRGSVLLEAKKWIKDPLGVINQEEKVFIQDSQKLQERELTERKRRKLLTIIACILIILSILIAVGSIVQSEQDQNRTILARNLISQAELTSKQDKNLQISVALATEAINQDLHVAAEQVLYNILPRLPRSSSTLAYQHSIVDAVAFSPNGKYLATAGLKRNTDKSGKPDSHGNVCVWKINNGKLNHKPLSCEEHEDSVNAVVFSQDEKYLATASLDGSACRWEIASSSLKKIKCIPPHKDTHKDNKSAVVFSPNGNYLATAGANETINLRNWNDDKLVSREQPSDYVKAIAFSPNGSYVAKVSLNGIGYVWDVNMNKLLAKFGSQKDAVNAIAFSPNSEYIATVGSGKTVGVWETTSGKQVTELGDHKNTVVAVAFSPNSEYLVTASLDGIVRLWHKWKTKDSKPIELKHEGAVTAVTFSPDGKYLATASSDNTGRVWEITSAEITSAEITSPIKAAAFMIHKDGVNAVVFSPDGKYVATGSLDGTARLWEISGDRPFKFMVHKDTVKSVAFSQDKDSKYLATASNENIVRIWGTNTSEKLYDLPHQEPVTDVAFSPNNKYLATVSNNKDIHVWERTNNKKNLFVQKPYLLQHQANVNAIVFSPDSNYIATASLDGNARIWEITNGKRLCEMPHKGSVTNVTFSSDGEDLATASRDNIARVWRKWNHTCVKVKPVELQHTAFVEAVAFSPNGKYLVTGGRDSTARVWEIDKKPLEPLVKLHNRGPVTAVTFSPSNSNEYLATLSNDNTVRVWRDWKTNRSKATFEIEHETPLTTMHFSHDGKYLATASTDGTACVWEESSSEKTCVQTGEHLVAMDFSWDGRYLAVANGNNVRILLWKQGKQNDLTKKACEHLTSNLTPEQWKQYLANEPFRKTCQDLP